MASRRAPERSLSARLAGARLSPALSRVAEVLLNDPEAVAFGTAASLAAAARTSPPTVVRLAEALGYDGYSALRDAMRDELSVRLATDAARVRTPTPGDPIERLRSVEHDNVDRTLDQLDETTFDAVVDLLDGDRRIWVLPSTQTFGVAHRFVDQLSIIGRRAVLLDGPEFRIASIVATLRAGDVFLTMDIPRHEHAVVRIQRDAVERGAIPVVLTGGPSTGLATDGGHVIPFAATASGPFDSLVGLTVVATALVNALVDRHRPQVTDRLTALERTWSTAALFDTP